ncbi:Bax inhibitor-1/YccA family protein [Derxia gummosa]|uniref:Bax inhibitor-1/YccA family protein n=1 Tax=Derxia gummosa DSM 723 TaxID=1121388 RepID=A0A8B6XC40_9BURK|nr:Bax inhibitor-1/YccA family protein [Derxia gummosa]
MIRGSDQRSIFGDDAVIDTRWAAPSAEQRQRVLRNTYALLALSMLPTIVGAWVGLSFNLGGLFRGWMGAIVFMAVAFGFFFAIEKYKNSSVGVALLLGFTGFMGVMLSGLLSVALRFSNGPQMITMTAGATAMLFFVLAGFATTTKRDLSNMGKFLTIGLVMLLVAMIANLFFQVPAFQLALLTISFAIFAGFLVFDLNRIVNGGETNYVTATLAVYLDLYNMFTSLLQLVMAFTGQRDE